MPKSRQFTTHRRLQPRTRERPFVYFGGNIPYHGLLFALPSRVRTKVARIGRT